MISIQKMLGILLIGGIGGVCGGYVGYLYADHRASIVTRSVRAERFELLGKDGKVRAFWGELQDGKVVAAFVDLHGKVKADFGVTNDGEVQWLCFYGRDGRKRVRLGTDEFFQSSLILGDDQHESRLIVGSIPGDLPVRSDSWGLVLPQKGTFDIWAGIGIRESREGQRTAPFLSIRDAGGLRWSAPVGE
jgi:hypothetical protein